MDATLNQNTLSISFPSEDLKLVKEIVKKFGWKINRKKKTGLEEALDDIKKGRVSAPCSSCEEMFKELGIHV